MNTAPQTVTPDAVPADLPQSATSQQTAVMALMTLMSPGLGVPEAMFDLHPSRPLFTVHVHRNPAGFEWWREALGLTPDNASDLEVLDGLDCCTVHIAGQIGTTDVRLIGYLPLPAETPADSDAA